MKGSHLIAAILAAAALFGSVPAHAVVIEETQEVYDFTGVCTDCMGTVSAQLVLKNYTPGNPIQDSNFGSFTYDGSNKIPGFTVDASNFINITGNIPVNLPAPATVHITFTTGPGDFLSRSSGFWATQSSDFGYTSSYSSAVPEPSTWALMLLGFAGLGVAAHRRARVTRAAVA